MLKIYLVKTKTPSSGVKCTLTIQGAEVSAHIANALNQTEGEDRIESPRSYSSYAFADNARGYVSHGPHGREILRTDFRFYDICRLGASLKEPYYNIMADMAPFGRLYLQIDTGIIAEAQKDYVISVWGIEKANLQVYSDQTPEYVETTDTEIHSNGYPRFKFWDSYSLTANGKEYKADCHARDKGSAEDRTLTADEDGFIQFAIRKYKGAFEEPLTRDYDNDDVYIETSAGIADTRRVVLTNGEGTFRLLTLGYKGAIKIKLGRKLYTPWNEYNLTLV